MRAPWSKTPAMGVFVSATLNGRHLLFSTGFSTGYLMSTLRPPHQQRTTELLACPGPDSNFATVMVKQSPLPYFRKDIGHHFGSASVLCFPCADSWFVLLILSQQFLISSTSGPPISLTGPLQTSWWLNLLLASVTLISSSKAEKECLGGWGVLREGTPRLVSPKLTHLLMRRTVPRKCWCSGGCHGPNGKVPWGQIGNWFLILSNWKKEILLVFFK